MLSEAGGVAGRIVGQFGTQVARTLPRVGVAALHHAAALGNSIGTNSFQTTHADMSFKATDAEIKKAFKDTKPEVYPTTASAKNPSEGHKLLKELMEIPLTDTGKVKKAKPKGVNKAEETMKPKETGTKEAVKTEEAGKNKEAAKTEEPGGGEKTDKTENADRTKETGGSEGPNGPKGPEETGGTEGAGKSQGSNREKLFFALSLFVSVAQAGYKYSKSTKTDEDTALLNFQVYEHTRDVKLNALTSEITLDKSKETRQASAAECENEIMESIKTLVKNGEIDKAAELMGRYQNIVLPEFNELGHAVESELRARQTEFNIISAHEETLTQGQINFRSYLIPSAINVIATIGLGALPAGVAANFAKIVVASALEEVTRYSLRQDMTPTEFQSNLQKKMETILIPSLGNLKLGEAEKQGISQHLLSFAANVANSVISSHVVPGHFDWHALGEKFLEQGISQCEDTLTEKYKIVEGPISKKKAEVAVYEGFKPIYEAVDELQEKAENFSTVGMKDLEAFKKLCKDTAKVCEKPAEKAVADVGKTIKQASNTTFVHSVTKVDVSSATESTDTVD